MLVVIYWEWAHSRTPPHPQPSLPILHQSLTFQFQHPLTPHPHQSQGKPSGYMLSPREFIQKRNTWKKHKVLKMWNLVRICTGVIPVLTTVGQCMFIHKGHHRYLHWILDRCQFHLSHDLDHCLLQHWRETWKWKKRNPLALEQEYFFLLSSFLKTFFSQISQV